MATLAPRGHATRRHAAPLDHATRRHATPRDHATPRPAAPRDHARVLMAYKNSKGLRQLSYSPTWRFEPILSPPVDSLPVIQRPWHLCHLAPTRHRTRQEFGTKFGKDPAKIRQRSGANSAPAGIGRNRQESAQIRQRIWILSFFLH